MIGELTEERFLQLKIEELMIEKEHFRLLKESYYDLISEKLSVYNSLLMNI